MRLMHPLMTSWPGTASREGIPRQGRGVHGAMAGEDDAVQWDALSRPDDDGIPYLDLFGIHPKLLALSQKHGVVRADVHELGDGFAGFAHGVGLEQLSYLVEHHHRHGFQIIPQ